MFEGIGTDRDEEGAKRRAMALFLTLGGLASVAGFTLGIAGFLATKQVIAPPGPPDPMPPLVELVPAPLALPDAPPPPPRARGRDDSDVHPTADAPSETPPPLKPAPDQPPPPPGGSPTGADQGDPNGKDDGQPNGHVGGTGDGPALGGPSEAIHVFAHQELEAKRQVQPDYPAAAPRDLGDVRCLATIRIDESGVPYSVEPRGCPEPFASETVAALLKWRWYPPKVNKQPTRAQTAIAVTYTLH